MGKIVVKKIQSQASTTAFQIPSTDGTTGQVIKTDGSGNLGWTDKSASIGSAGINYTMPAADGTAGKILQTDGTTGNLNAEEYASTYEDLLDQGYTFDFYTELQSVHH